MQPSIFQRLRIATYAFLALILLGLGFSTWLTLREQRLLKEAALQLERLYAFERTHIVIAQRIIRLREPGVDEDGQRQVREQVDRLVVMSVSPDAVTMLRSILPRLPAIDDGSDREPLLALYQAVILEREHGSKVLSEIEADTDSHLQLELVAPVAIVAAGMLLLPFTRRRIIQPIDAFARQLSRLAAGERGIVPVDEKVSPFLLPVHMQFNALASHLAELEAAQRARADSLEAEVRKTTGALLEQQRSLARAERLAATGELAASVAHELRNPLAGIQMTLTNLRRELSDHPELAARIDLVLDELTRLSRLLTSLLDTARHAPEPAREVHLAALADDILALARCQVPTEVHLESNIPAALVARLPQDRLRQALLNLVLNAAAAVGGRGTVTIDATVDGDELCLRVADDGPGFPPEVLERGIRPFFSTRERGTGLGLAMVRRFAADLGGEVRLANRQPHGAEVTIVVPTLPPA